MTADDVEIARLSAVICHWLRPVGLAFAALIGAVNKLESSVIPLLARPQGGVAASSRKFCAATEADAAGVVFHLFSSENHPGLAVSGGFAIIFGSLGHPSLRDARRGIPLFQFF